MDLSPLPITYQAVIPEEFLDEMGHMNVMWYTHLFDQATWNFFSSFRMDQDYFDNAHAGAFALEQHTRFLSEVRQGQSVRLQTRTLGWSSKRVHFMHFMSVGEPGFVAATTELVGIHIDQSTRRSSPFPAQIAAAIDQIFILHQQLDWEAPDCGVMAP
jgi:acyl-CoA thioester hydrolase